MMHSDPDSLVVMAELLHQLARQIHPLRVANPALARGIREAGMSLARSVAGGHLAPGPVTGGLSMAHRERACQQAETLIHLLQQGIDAGYFLPDIRRQAQHLAIRLVNLLRAGR